MLDFLAHVGATAFLWFSIAVMLIGVAQYILYLSCLPYAFLEMNKRSQRDDDHACWELLRSSAVPPISIIVPAYNEEPTIAQSVLALLALQYPNVQVIVVNDGSKDKTADVVISEFDMVPTYLVRETETIQHAPIRQIYKSNQHPNLIFVDKENGKKADAINAGISCVRTPLFCVIDADSLLEPDALLKAVRPFVESGDNVVAVGGTVGIVNGCEVEGGQVTKFALPRKFIPRVQVVEYTRAYLSARLAASRKGSFALISGAFGIFRRDIAVAVGGYDKTTVGEDMELVLRMHRYMLERGEPYAVRYVPEPVCWTEAPDDLTFLSNQRKRWQRGGMECIERHWAMMFRPKYRRLGMVTLPQFLLCDLISPAAELVGYFLLAIFVLLGWTNWYFFFTTYALVASVGVFISTMALALEQDEIERFRTPRDLWFYLLTSVIENFGYRQICSYWRLKAFVEYVSGKKASWGAMDRRGFNTVKST